MPALYDLMILLDPNAPEERQGEILGTVRSMIDSSGSIVGEYDWGTRRMTFEIDHRPEAAYHLLQIEAEPELLERLRHSLKITDGVLRSRIIRAKPGLPVPPAPPATRVEPARARDEEGDTQVAPRAAADA
jgi:small subunit ribosomal protein S6